MLHHDDSIRIANRRQTVRDNQHGAIAAQFNPRIMTAYGLRGPSMLSLINAVFSLGAITAPYGFVLLGGNPRPVFAA